MIEIKSLSKSFGETQVLKNISLSISKGEKIVIMGPSGCGKSTFLRILATLESFQSGEISINNKDLLVTKPISQILSMVFQSFNLFGHKTVLSNLIFAPTKIHKQNKARVHLQAKSILEKLGLTNQANQYPTTLSGGQKQRVAIARALMLDPPILLFDEPTSALDPEMTAEVLSTLENLAQLDKTILCVTHEVEFARRFADKIAYFSDGEIIFFDETDKFFESKHSSIQGFLNNLTY